VHDEKPASTPKRAPNIFFVQNEIKSIRGLSKKIQMPSFLIGDDCGHNSIRYEPSKDRACDCDTDYNIRYS
jgi:hypothetical protein